MNHPGGTKKARSPILYNLFRNPLTHALGIETETSGKGDQATVRVRQRNKPLAIRIAKQELSEESIEELERSESRPAWLKPTITSDQDAKTLFVSGLYWGVRQMVRRLTAKQAFMQRAEKFLACSGSLGRQNSTLQ